eukprot:TRINITY_DN28512_c0_g4_i1.p2 TRINITY_DN28512_c0_g4~~TRINITY_DN28512_c0_g4_i1.p2  ORF type:complete len:142 (-),score=10.24 TRINITY_DN28512_c0_g4_i1:280-705(-)
MGDLEEYSPEEEKEEVLYQFEDGEGINTSNQQPESPLPVYYTTFNPENSTPKSSNATSPPQQSTQYQEETTSDTDSSSTVVLLVILVILVIITLMILGYCYTRQVRRRNYRRSRTGGPRWVGVHTQESELTSMRRRGATVI